MANNTVNQINSPNTVVITDRDQNQILVTQPVTQVLEVGAVGPQGQKGDTGPQGPQGIPGPQGPPGTLEAFEGIIVTGSSIFSGSTEFTNLPTIQVTGSFAILGTGSLNGSGILTSVFTASYNTFTASYYTDSSSFSTRVTSLEAFSASLDNTFVTETELNQATASLSASIAYLSSSYLASSASFDTRILNNSASISSLSSSFVSFSGSYNTGSFTGSFTGNGAGLTNIPASGIVGLNLSQIASGSATASISPTDGFRVNTNTIITGSLTVSGSSTLINIGPAIFSGSLIVNEGITGSLLGTASYAANALTSSYAITASYAENAGSGTQIASGSATASISGIDGFRINTNTVVTGSLTATGGLTASSAIISGDVIVQGTASINTLVVNQTQYTSGSNQLGDGPEDVQTLFGTVRIPTGSLTVTGSVFITGSTVALQGGSFSGSGANLFNIPASGITGLNLSQIATGSVTASVSPGTGSFRITSGSTNLLFVSSSGNVGIGTSTPNSKLDVSGSGRFSGNLISQYENARVTATPTNNAQSHGFNSLSGVEERMFAGYIGSSPLYGTSLSTYFGSPAGYKISFGIGNTICQTIFLTGNIGINTTTDAGFKLDVNGTGRFQGNLTITGSATNSLLVKGSGTTSATFSAYFVNSSGQETFQVRDDGAVKIGGGSYGHPSVTRFQVNDLAGNGILRLDPTSISVPTSLVNLGTSNLTISGNQSLILQPGNGNIGTINIGNAAVNNIAYTNTTRDFLTLNQGWNAVTGSSNLTMNALVLSNAINFTNSTGTNIARGLYVNPTLTSVPGYRAIETTTGSVIFNGGNVGIGVSSPNFTLDVSGSSEFIGNVLITGSTLLTGSLTVTGSISSTGGITGSLFGTSSFASTASFVNPLTQSVLITGSISINTTSSKFNLTVKDSGRIGSDFASDSFIQFGNAIFISPGYNTYTLRNLAVGVGDLSARLGVRGSGTTSSTTALLVQNANASASLEITDDLNSRFYGSVGINIAPTSTNLTVGGRATITSRLRVGSTGDPNNTLEVWGNNTYQRSNGSVWAIFNQTSESVGIGISSPNFRLDVSGSGRFTNGLTVTGSTLLTGSLTVTGSTTLSGSSALTVSGNANLFGDVYASGLFPSSGNRIVYVDGDNGRLSQAEIPGSSGQVFFNNSSNLGAASDLYWNNSNLRLGIRNSNPSFTLDVSGSGRFNNDLTTSGSFTAGVSSVGRYIGNVSDTSSINNGLTVRGDLVVAHTNILSQLVFGYTNSTKYLYVGTDVTGPYFKGTTVLDIRVVNGVDVGLYVKSDNTAFFNSSNVSINGTTGLGEKTLQVNGSGRFTNTLSVTGSTDIRGSGTTSATAALTVNNSAASRVLTVLDNGRVGIGTTSPSASLQVGPVVDTFAVGVSLTGEQNLIARNTVTHHNWLPYTDGNNYFSAGSHTFRNQNMSGVGLYVTNTFTGVGTNVNSGFTFDVSGSGRFTSGLIITGSSSSDGTGAVIIRNTTGTGNFRPALQLIQPFQMGWGVVMEIKGNGVDKSGLLFSNDSTSNSWTIGQGVYGSTDNFAIGYRGGSVNSWATPYVVLTTGGNLGIGTSSPGFRLDVSGSSEFVGNVFITGSTFITASASTSSAALYVYKSGSTTVDIQGSQGQLFSIVDSLSGSLMSVNDVSGLPILEVFSDDRVTMGTFGSPAMVITGSSTIVSGSMRGRVVTLSTASATASMDCSLSNFFNLVLSSSSTIHLSASNIQPGQTINLRVTQPATSGSLTYTTQFKFAGGIPYTASSTGSAVDIISFITFDTTNLYGSAIKNLS